VIDAAKSAVAVAATKSKKPAFCMRRELYVVRQTSVKNNLQYPKADGAPTGERPVSAEFDGNKEAYTENHA
jgi:hypothetical protein